MIWSFQSWKVSHKLSQCRERVGKGVRRGRKSMMPVGGENSVTLTIVEGNGQTQKTLGTNELNCSSAEGGAEAKEGMWTDSWVYSSGIGRTLLPWL